MKSKQPGLRLLAAGTVLLSLALLSGCGGSSTRGGTGSGAAASDASYGPTTKTEDGYLTLSDGTRLRYHLERAVDAPPGPVLLQYDGYDSGTGGYFSNIPGVKARLLLRGYTVMGVSLRGTGCSSGEFSLFDPQWGVDGAEAVEWAASQPWSDGNIGMIGYSFPGITQLMVAAQRPPHLRAIAPANVIFDLYRDVGSPGGIPNLAFATLFTAQQEAPGLLGIPDAILQGDPECAANHLRNRLGYESFLVQGLQSPHIDGPFGWSQRSPSSVASRIDVPVLNVNYWQDEQTGSRIGGVIEPGGLLRTLRRDRTWSVMSNGNHDITEGHPLYSQMLEQFFEHYLRGVDNGWERTPRFQLLHELDASTHQPNWITAWDDLPSPRPAALYLRAAETLLPEPPVTSETADEYSYPLASPSNNPLPGYADALHLLWQTPAPAAGRLVYTTPGLAQDLQLFGSASLDLWLSSTATDTDLQGTITEVRPDGQEVYVARGWLRASKRALDESHSTPLRPYPLYTEASTAALQPGEPTAMRLEIFPFAHRFRAGSALRLIVDAPTGTTGDWGSQYNPVPAINTVLHDASHPSRLVVGVLEGGPAVIPAPPACGALANQPCRASIAPVPQGSVIVQP